MKIHTLSIISSLLLAMVIPSSSHCELFKIAYEKGRIVREYPQGSQPVIGLALSGGGARGIAQLGVIEVLEKAGIEVNCIAGTSMGSIIGGLYAAGYSTSSMIDILENIDWNDTFRSAPQRRNIYVREKETIMWPLFEVRFNDFRPEIPSSLSSGQRIISILSWLTLHSDVKSEKDFDRLPIPFRSIATDLETGEKVVLSKGNLGRSIQASSTIPPFFSPVEWDGRLLVDGGLRENLPVEEVKAMGSDFVIAVLINESMHPLKALNNPLNIADQTTSILMRNRTAVSRAEADFVISPDMEGFLSSDFTNITDIIEQGRFAAIEALPELMDLLYSIKPNYSRTYFTGTRTTPNRYQALADSIFWGVNYGGGVFLADISSCMDALWDTGLFISIEGELGKDGILDLKLTRVPYEVNFKITGSGLSDYFDKGHQIKFDRTVPSQTIITRINSLLHVIRFDGYSFAEITETRINPENNSLDVIVTVPHLTRIFIDSDLVSKRSVVLREFEIQVGETLNLEKVMQTVENLYGTNLYEWVYFDAEPYRDGIALRLHLKEKTSTVARFGLRYDSIFKTEGRITLSRENILGFGGEFTLTAQAGSKMNVLLLQNRVNRVGASYFTSSVKTYRQYWRRRYGVENESYEFEDERYGIIMTVGQQMDKLGDVLLQFKSETVRNYFPGFLDIRDRNYELRSVVVRSLIDSYDRYPFPLSGSINQIYIESASDVLGGSEKFTKIFWGFSNTRTFHRRHSLTGGFLLGTADPTIPDVEAFTLGGWDSRKRFYDSETAASHIYADFPGLNAEERNGTRMIVGRLTYRLHIPRWFYLEFLYRTGNVWPRGALITTHSFLHSFGIRGSVASIAGPFSLGWGTTSEGDRNFFMSAGWDF